MTAPETNKVSCNIIITNVHTFKHLSCDDGAPIQSMSTYSVPCSLLLFLVVRLTYCSGENGVGIHILDCMCRIRGTEKIKM